jgi:hypothetical protein
MHLMAVRGAHPEVTMSAVVSNENELYLAPGGPEARLVRRIGVRERGAKRSLLRRILTFLLITWVPMCIFALLQGTALGPTPRASFLLDFATYARFFIGLPILLVADVVVGSRLRLAGLEFVRDDLIRSEDVPAFERAVARLARRRESLIATLVIVALAAVGAWRFTFESAAGMIAADNWRSIVLPEGHALHYSLAALWNNLVALPIVLFLVYRWLWRILSWAIFLADVARLDLQVVPTHADRAAGLGFLQVAHASFASIALGLASVASAEAAFGVVYEGARITSFQIPLIVLIVVMELLFLGPLLVFCPTLARSRRAALASYGGLVSRYNRAFHEKWIVRPVSQEPKGEPLLGSADIQSLADMGNSFRFVTEMRIVPFGRRAILQLALAVVIPFVPLVFLVVPVSQIVEALKKVVF